MMKEVVKMHSTPCNLIRLLSIPIYILTESPLLKVYNNNLLSDENGSCAILVLMDLNQP